MQHINQNTLNFLSPIRCVAASRTCNSLSLLIGLSPSHIFDRQTSDYILRGFIGSFKNINVPRGNLFESCKLTQTKLEYRIHNKELHRWCLFPRTLTMSVWRFHINMNTQIHSFFGSTTYLWQYWLTIPPDPEDGNTGMASYDACYGIDSTRHKFKPSSTSFYRRVWLASYLLQYRGGGMQANIYPECCSTIAWRECSTCILPSTVEWRVGCKQTFTLSPPLHYGRGEAGCKQELSSSSPAVRCRGGRG